MSHSDRQFMTSLREVIATEMREQIKTEVQMQINERLNQVNSFDIEDYRGDIETMISEYINYNVTVTLEA